MTERRVILVATTVMNWVMTVVCTVMEAFSSGVRATVAGSVVMIWVLRLMSVMVVMLVGLAKSAGSVCIRKERERVILKTCIASLAV